MGNKTWWIVAVIVVIVIAGYFLLGRGPKTGPAAGTAEEATTAETAAPPAAAATPQSAVEAYFALLAEGKLAEAYAAQAAAARAEDTLAVFSTSAAEAGLTTATPGTWQVGETTETEALVTGTVTLQNGKTLPLAITLVVEDGGWRIRAIGAAQ